jgi:hypothetical protein
LNCHRIVYPLVFGGLDGVDDWTLADWCDQCHRKGGLVIAADFFRGRRWQRGEVVADLLLGKVDALDVTGCFAQGKVPTAELLRPWYQLLNCGLRVPLVGGSGKDSNADLLGSTRTFARLPSGEALTYRAWVEAVRAGRTFVTDEPLLLLSVDGHEPGAVLDLPTARPVHVRAELSGVAPFDRLEVIANGQVVAERPPTCDPSSPEGTGPQPPNREVLEADVLLEEGGWIAARCGVFPCAHTSPVYVQVGGRPPRPDPAALAVVRGHLDGMLEWVEREGRFENDKQRQRLAGIFQSARGTLGPG